MSDNNREKKLHCLPFGVFFFLFLFTSLAIPAHVCGSAGRPVEIVDIMEFNQIVDPQLSRLGNLVAYERRPDRGDGAVVVINDQGREQLAIPGGTGARISSDEQWVLARIQRPFLKRLEKDTPADSLGVWRVDQTDSLFFGKTESAFFTEDSRWLVILGKPETPAKRGEPSGAGGRLEVHDLWNDRGARLVHDDVRQVTADSLSTSLFFAVTDSSGEGNGLYLVNLRADSLLPQQVHRQTRGIYSGFSWHERSGTLAFLHSREDQHGNPSPSRIMTWHPDRQILDTVPSENELDDDQVIPVHSSLTWSADGERLFFGWQPRSMYTLSLYRDEPALHSVTDIDTILAGATVDVWHWNDPLIKTHEKNTWNRRRDHTYLTVYHLERNRVVRLADDKVPYVSPDDNKRFVLGRNPRPYKKLITWDGTYNDYYLIDIRDGTRHEIIDRLRSTTVSHSPDGRYVAFFEAGHWQLYDVDRNTIRNLTEPLGVPFANEDHDYSFPAPGYGMAGWLEGDRALVIYDKYDIWQIDTRSGEARMLTGGEGRRQKIRFRVVTTDPDRRSFRRNEHLLVSGFGERNKEYGFYGIRTGRTGIERFVEGPYRYRFVAQAKKADRLIFTRESYREFPDLWIADRRLRSSRKITEVNPRIKEFAWGESQLVRWLDMDGHELDGVLILPGNYQPGKRYPVLVYFYEQFSHRLHHFNEQVINHRPGFPYYASHGYAIFLPDVRYDIGQPGYSATRSIVPGVQKLIEKGIADPDAIALHGHSWSGYQAAHMAAQTHIFAAIIAGAPVSNMTSAYSGIRWSTGLARQFQYEMTQSRIGGSLWEKRERYIENSPVFFADRIRTPMLIMFGDEDGAVPWEQGIELYLAMRRLHKDVIFLQYRGEGHHPREYANKLDYYIRMKEYLDHYLKGEPAPEWIREGLRYEGR